jgi:hypothetical protein
MKYLLIIIVPLFLLSGCSSKNMPEPIIEKADVVEIVTSSQPFLVNKDVISDSQKEIAPLTYVQVMASKVGDPEYDYYESSYKGKLIEWQGKISGYYSQITGIKFCVIDEGHQNVDIDKPCDWFWAFSRELMGADDIAINPNWDGKWVNYILNYYKVPFNKDSYFYNDVYTIKGVVNGIDCISKDQCVPDIDIINISK